MRERRQLHQSAKTAYDIHKQIEDLRWKEDPENEFILIVETEDDLPTLSEPSLAYVEQSTLKPGQGLYYLNTLHGLNWVWDPVGTSGTTIHSASDYTALQALVSSLSLAPPQIGHVQDHDYQYWLEGNTFRIRGHFKQDTQPSGQGERIGDIWVDTSTSPNQMKWFAAAGVDWKKLSHYKVSI